MIYECLVTQACPILCDPMDCSLPGPSVHGILQARIPEWVPCPPPGDLPHPGMEAVSLMSPALAGRFFPSLRRKPKYDSADQLNIQYISYFF